jgi:hypothetical protein
MFCLEVDAGEEDCGGGGAGGLVEAVRRRRVPLASPLPALRRRRAHCQGGGSGGSKWEGGDGGAGSECVGGREGGKEPGRWRWRGNGRRRIGARGARLEGVTDTCTKQLAGDLERNMAVRSMEKFQPKTMPTCSSRGGGGKGGEGKEDHSEV